MSASCDLARLIARYRFLQGELDCESLRDAPCRAAAASALDDVFLQIVRFQAEEPAISYRQIEFLMTFLAEGLPDAEMRRLISTEALAHVRRLMERVGPRVASSRVKRDRALIE